MASTCIVQEQSHDANITLEALPREVPGAESLTGDSHSFLALEKWNHPRINIYRSFSTFWSFLVMGANDAAYGVSAVSSRCDPGLLIAVFSFLVKGFDSICKVFLSEQ